MLSHLRRASDEVSESAVHKGLLAWDRTAVESAVYGPLMRMQDDLTEKFAPLVLDMLAAGGNAAAEDLQDIRRKQKKETHTIRTAAKFEATFDKKNPVAIAFAERHAAEKITQITEQSRLAVRSVITEAFRDGITTQDQARLIKNIVSLSERDALAVQNLRTRMLASPGRVVQAGKVAVRVPPLGASVQQLDRATGAYASRLLKSRAENIARTETMTVANIGQQQYWQQQVSKGKLNRDAMRELIITPDERLCPICSAMAGQIVRIDQHFDKGEPPFHQRCRCTHGLVFDSVEPLAELASAPLEGTTTVDLVERPGLRKAAPVTTEKPRFRKVTMNNFKQRGKLTGEGLTRAESFKTFAQGEMKRLSNEFEGLEGLNIAQLDIVDEKLLSGDARGRYWSGGMDRLQMAVKERWNPASGSGGGVTLGNTWTVGNDVQSTLRHEIGHHVHLERFGQYEDPSIRASWRPTVTYSKGQRTDMQGEWDAIWNKYESRIGEIKSKVSQYAATNDKELFAESFAAYTNPKYGELDELAKIEQQFVHETKRAPLHLPNDIESFMEKWIGKRKVASQVLERTAPRGVVSPIVEKSKRTITPIPGKTTMTEDIVKVIRRRRTEGEGVTAIARSYGLNPSYVRQIIDKKIWKQVV